MRILAIRGKNLASLAGEFELDFQREPLASAGLYAITGATGSGKSTLLDALCLALYEQTPRLSGILGSGTITDVGNNAITAADVRTILRRGCSDAYAEVDFVGSNSVAYRSRWSVRRAHGKASGKLQQTELNLLRIRDGQALGDHRKSETLRLIESYVGLSFAQFTRAVLLAQNDFTAFLKASDDARAELLQTLTGTENYAKISMLAFERMKAEKAKLAALQEQWQSLAPLSPELRAEKTAQLQAQSAQIEALVQQKLAIEAQLRWYQLGDQLQEQEASAREILATALAGKNAAAARALQLELLDKVQPARPLRLELARLDQAEADAAQAYELAQTAFAQAQAAHDACAVKQIAALQHRDSAEAAKVHAQPDIDAAKAVDASIATLTPQVAAALQECESASDQLQLELSQQADAVARRQSDQAKLAAAQQWLLNNDTLRPLAEAWQRWETLFDEAHNILERQAKADARGVELKREIAAFEIRFIDASETQNQAVQAQKLTQAQLSQLSADCSALDFEQLALEKAALDLRHEQLQSALTLWPKLVDVRSQIQKQSQQLQQHDEVRTNNAEVLREGLQNLPVLACAEQIAKDSLQLATLAASENAESMRAGLQPEKACPVCGALSHPYVVHAPATNMLKSLQDQLSAKGKALRELELCISATRESSARAEQAISAAQPLLDELAHEQARLKAEWASHPMRSELDAVAESQRFENLMERQKMVLGARDRVRAQEAHYWSLRKRQDAAQAQVDIDNSKLAKADAALRHLDAVRTAATQNLSSAQRDLAELTAQLAAKQTQLDAAFPSQLWRVEWQRSPNAFVAQRRVEVDSWAAQLADEAALKTHIAQLQITLSACEKACLQAHDRHTKQLEKHAALALTLQSFSEHRNALFAGRPIIEVEAKLNAAVLQAKAALMALEAAMKTAQAQLARTQEAANQTGIRLAQERSAANLARLRLNTWLLKFNAENSDARQNLTLLALHSLLEVAPEWRANERAALQALSSAVQSAQAVLNARSDSLSAHLAAQSVFEARAELQVRLDQLQLQISELSEAIASLALVIALDAKSAQQADALSKKIEKQMIGSRVWSQLGELIGSADGKKFRNFAQQLTLDILLSYANQHLQTLTRRYRVQRINDSLGLLVVDQDMGDELRSVHSLSGGESFLLSLALALGLASLSSHRVQVESLFIDEGFGSLDAESLSIAMDALDNLQAQGRKVGVISHLAELTERIGVTVQVQRQAGGLSKIVIR